MHIFKFYDIIATTLRGVDMKNLEEDSYGFITDIDDVVGSEEYQQLPTEEKKKILLSILSKQQKKKGY
mgnify:CR=1 FL=1